jgi:hypothetical protein
MSNLELFVILGSGALLALGNFGKWIVRRRREQQQKEMKAHIERIFGR